MKQNKRGRPETDRKNTITIRISDDALRILDGEHNKSELIDALIRGKAARLQCPKCGTVITIKTED